MRHLPSGHRLGKALTSDLLLGLAGVCLWGNLRRVSVFAFLALVQGIELLIFTHYFKRFCDFQKFTMPPPNPSANLGFRGVASAALFS